MYKKRLKNLCNQMKKENIEQLILSTKSSIFYFLGETIDPGERFLALLINQTGEITLFINKLFSIDRDLNIDTVWYDDTDDILKIFSNHINDGTTIGVEHELSAGFLLKMLELTTDIYVKNISKLVHEMRMIKDEKEQNLLRNASKINDEAMKEVLKDLKKTNFSELEILNNLTEVYLQKGAEGVSFEPLICYGPNCAEPHHVSDHTQLEKDQSIIVDIGCVKDGYCSDMTRSFFYGKPSKEYLKIYDLVLKANEKAIEAIKPGLLLSEIDKIGRKIIAQEGYGEFFTHRIGHNIGIDVHEYPDVSSTSDIKIQEGMVFSIEPGIYIPGKYGVRIEDLILVTKNGCEILNNYPKELIII